MKLSTDLYRSIAPEKKGSQHNLQLDDRLIRGSIPIFSPIIANEAVGKRQTSIDKQLLDLPCPYHRHAIDTFNTCSRGPTHQSLTDTGGSYNVEGAGFPHTTPRPSQPTVSLFCIQAPPGLQFIQVLSTKSEFEFKGTYARHVVFRPLGHLPWPTTMPSHS
jgi:hypothetical protein